MRETEREVVEETSGRAAAPGGLRRDAQRKASELGSAGSLCSSASKSDSVLLDGFLRQTCARAGVRGHRAGWVHELSIAKPRAQCRLTTHIVSLDFCSSQERQLLPCSTFSLLLELKKKFFFLISTTTVLIQGSTLTPHLDYLSNLPPDFPIPDSVPTPKREFCC